MDWTIRVEETRVGLTDDGQYVIVLSHVRNRGSNADWKGTITRTDDNVRTPGAVVYRDAAADAETLILRCKAFLAESHAIRERDPFTRNERDPLPADET